VHAGFNDDGQRPFGEANVTRMYVTEDWKDGVGVDDLGLVTLDRNLGDFTGYLGYSSVETFADEVRRYLPFDPITGLLGEEIERVARSQPLTERVKVLHYPADEGYDGLNQYDSTGRTTWIDSDFIYTIPTNIFITHGSSGGPVLVDGSVIGIVKGDQTAFGKQYALQFIRLHDGWSDFIADFLDEYEPPTDRPALVDHDTWFGTDEASLSASAAHVGESVAFQTKVFNSGTATANDVKVRFIMSRNGDSLNESRIIGNVVIPKIDPFQSVTAVLTVDLPNVLAGKYDIISVIDPDNEIREFATPWNDLVVHGVQGDANEIGLLGSSALRAESLQIINDRPVIHNTKFEFTVYQGDHFTREFVATDVEGFPIRWSLVLDSSIAAMVGARINSLTGELDWTIPNNQSPGVYQPSILVKDGVRTLGQGLSIKVKSAKPQIGALFSDTTRVYSDGRDAVSLSVTRSKIKSPKDVERVEFFLDRNKNGTLDLLPNGDVDANKDEMIGFDLGTANQDYAWLGALGNLPVGKATFFARAVIATAGGLLQSNIAKKEISVVASPPVQQVAFPTNIALQLNTRINPTTFAAADQSGNFVVLTPGAQLFSPRVELDRVSTAGEPIGSTVVLEGSVFSKVAIRPDGSILAVWADDTSNRNILARRYTAEGNTIDSLPLSLGTLSLELDDVGVDANGDILLVGSENTFTGHQVVGKRFTWEGSAIGAEFSLLDKQLTAFSYGDVAVSANGNFTLLFVQWDLTLPSAEQWSLRTRTFNKSGSLVGNEVVIRSMNTSGEFNKPQIAMNAAGEGVVLYDGPHLFAQRIDAMGKRAGDPVKLNTSLAPRSDIWVSLSDSGWIAATWAARGRDPDDSSSESGVYLQVVDKQNNLRGPEQLVPARHAGDQFPMAIAMNAEANLAVAWRDSTLHATYVRPYFVNLPPSIPAQLAQTALVGKPFRYTVTATDPELSRGQHIEYSLADGSPSGMSIDLISGEISWTPTPEQAGQTYSIYVNAADNGTPSYSTSTVVPVTVMQTDVVALNLLGHQGDDKVDFSYLVENDVPVSFAVSFYRSDDGVYSTDDTLLGSRVIASAADLAVGTHTVTFTIGQGADKIPFPGAGAPNPRTDYRILAVIDVADAVPEEDANPTAEDNTALFSGAYHLPGGPVFVHGTDGSNQLNLRRGSVIVQLDDQEWTYDEADVSEIEARLGESGDAISGNDVTKKISAWGGPGNDVMTGGSEDDQLNGGPGDDQMLWSLGTDSIPSESTEFSPPQFVPLNSTTDTTPTLEWNDISGAASYELVLKANIGDNLLTTFVASSELTIQDALRGGIYQLQVRAIDLDNNVTGWSEAMEFTVDEPVADVPQMASPSGTIQTVQPAFTWSKVAGATAYDLRIERTDQSLSELIVPVVGTNRHTLATRLTEGDYLISVRAINSEHDLSEWSPQLPIKIDIPTPGKPVLLSPSTTIANTTPVLTWSPAEFSHEFEVQIDRTTAGSAEQAVYVASNIVTSGSSHDSVQIPEVLQPGNYDFRIRATNASGEVGLWSDPMSFTIDLTDIPPATPEILFVPPANASTSLLFGWTTAMQATSYELKIERTGPVPAEVVFSRSGVLGAEIDVPHMFPIGNYQVQVRAINSLGASLWSDAVAFNLTNAGTSSPPVDISLSNTNVKERVSGLTIGTLSASGPEAGKPHTFTTDDSRFEVVGTVLKLRDDQFLELTSGATVNVEVTVRDSGNPAQSLTKSLVIAVAENVAPWSNLARPFDANDDGAVSPLDVLVLVNLLNSPTGNVIGDGGRLVTNRPGTTTLPYYDPNGDGFCTPVDVLQIVNFLNGAASEGESPMVFANVPSIDDPAPTALRTAMRSVVAQHPLPPIAVAKSTSISLIGASAARKLDVFFRDLVATDELGEWESILDPIARHRASDIR
jgi:hypothetical protein